MDTITGEWSSFLKDVAGAYVASDITKRNAKTLQQPTGPILMQPSPAQDGQPVKRSAFGGINPLYLAAGAVALVGLVLLLKKAK